MFHPEFGWHGHGEHRSPAVSEDVEELHDSTAARDKAMVHNRAFLLALWDLPTDQEVISAEQTPAWVHNPQTGPSALQMGTDSMGQPSLRTNI